MSKNMHPGISKFANVMDTRMTEQIEGASFPSIDFATVLDDYSLKLNQFGRNIPKGDYFVINTLNVGTTDFEFAETTTDTHTHDAGLHSGHISGDGSHSHTGGEHKHMVKLPERMCKLLPGDRVVVVWAEGTPVVLGKVEEASAL